MIALTVSAGRELFSRLSVDFSVGAEDSREELDAFDVARSGSREKRVGVDRHDARARKWRQIARDALSVGEAESARRNYDDLRVLVCDLRPLESHRIFAGAA